MTQENISPSMEDTTRQALIPFALSQFLRVASYAGQQSSDEERMEMLNLLISMLTALSKATQFSMEHAGEHSKP